MLSRTPLQDPSWIGLELVLLSARSDQSSLTGWLVDLVLQDAMQLIVLRQRESAVFGFLCDQAVFGLVAFKDTT